MKPIAVAIVGCASIAACVYLSLHDFYGMAVFTLVVGVILAEQI